MFYIKCTMSSRTHRRTAVRVVVVIRAPVLFGQLYKISHFKHLLSMQVLNSKSNGSHYLQYRIAVVMQFIALCVDAWSAESLCIRLTRSSVSIIQLSNASLEIFSQKAGHTIQRVVIIRQLN